MNLDTTKKMCRKFKVFILYREFSLSPGEARE